MPLYDLHSHSSASDGELSPSELIQRASSRQVNVLALTDHDTTAGLVEAHRENQRLANPMTLIDGVEISSSWHNFDIHIVGLMVDVENKKFQHFLAEQRQKRTDRALEIGRRLEKAKMLGAYDGAKKLAGDAAISRAHFARWMVEQGYVKNMNAVFSKYLVRGKTGYVPNQWADITDVIQQIHDAGGVAVLAHPSRYKMTTKWLRRLLKDFCSAGGDAMEVRFAQQTTADKQLLLTLAKEFNLYTSLGSDFHAPSPWVDLGKNLYVSEQHPWIWKSSRWQEKITELEYV